MTVKIAIMTMKGGQAKTALSINLADLIAKAGRSVVLIDSDVQANVTTVFQRDHRSNLASLILGQVQQFEFIQLAENFDFLPSGGKLLAEASRYISNSRFRESILKRLCQNLTQNFVIFDCAPSWNEINENILMYVDYVIIPVVTDYLGYSGCDQAMAYIESLKKESCGVCEAKILGIAITRLNRRTNIANTVLQELTRRWHDLLFQNVIEESVSIQEAPAFHQSIFDYRSGKTKGAMMYEALCKEILERIVYQQSAPHLQQRSIA